MDLSTYILTAMLFWSPLHKNMHEDPGERLERYKSIAHDIAEVSKDPNEKSLFSDQFKQEKTALLLASFAFHESNFNKDVDNGQKRGDHGRSVCIMQVMTHSGDFNYSAEYLLENRMNCIRAGLNIALISDCGGPITRRFRGYASGSCKEKADKEKEERIATAAKGLVSGYLTFIYAYPVQRFID